MTTSRQIAAEIIAVAQQLGKDVCDEPSGTFRADAEYDSYSVDEGVSTLVRGVPLVLLQKIHTTLHNAGSDSELASSVSAVIRKAIIPYLEMLDECDPDDPDTPSPLTEQELVDLDLDLDLLPLVSRMFADGSRTVTDRQLLGNLSMSRALADTILDDQIYPFPYAGDRKDFRKRLMVGSLVVHCIMEMTVEYINPKNTEARTRWLLVLSDNVDLLIKYQNLIRERGKIDWDLLETLERNDGAPSLTEGAL